MRIPRDLSSMDLVKKLAQLGYGVTRQTGSHIRLTTAQNGEHHITIPDKTPLSIGTLNAILLSIASHNKITKTELIRLLKL